MTYPEGLWRQNPPPYPGESRAPKAMKRTALKRKTSLVRPVKRKPRRLVIRATKRSADTEFSRTIRKRAGWKCERCGTYYGPKAGTRLHCAHIFSKGAFPHLRYDPDNVIALCYRHHRWWAHIDPVDFTEWVQKHIGEAKFEALKTRAHQGGKNVLDRDTADMVQSDTTSTGDS